VSQKDFLMAKTSVLATGVERSFDLDEVIVSKTDLQGRLTYVNDVFIRVSAYSESELIGKPHNVIRHPEMPRSIFQLLWDTIRHGKELFAYINNLAADGAYYWVFAHITPSLDTQGNVLGYHSNRRVPDRDAINEVSQLYSMLLTQEKLAGRGRASIDAGTDLLQQTLARQNQTYDEYVWGLATKSVERL